VSTVGIEMVMTERWMEGERKDNRGRINTNGVVSHYCSDLLVLMKKQMEELVTVRVKVKKKELLKRKKKEQCKSSFAVTGDRR